MILQTLLKKAGADVSDALHACGLQVAVFHHLELFLETVYLYSISYNVNVFCSDMNALFPVAPINC